MNFEGKNLALLFGTPAISSESEDERKKSKDDTNYTGMKVGVVKQFLHLSS